MKRLLFSAAFVAAVGLGTVAAFSQLSRSNEDDVAARQSKFPLAAKAGEDSHAIDKAPEGALNQGKFDDKTWKFGKAFDAPAGSKIWNPVKLKMMRGGKVTGGTRVRRHRSGIYCAMANAGYDFIWTEHQHRRPRLETDRAHVGGLPACQGGARRARRLYRRARRAACVGYRRSGAGGADGAFLVPLNSKARGGTGDTRRTLQVCELLLHDRDDMVVKAMSWSLRELAKRDVAAVDRFLSEHQNVLAPRVSREVGNKLRTGLKNPRK